MGLDAQDKILKEELGSFREGINISDYDRSRIQGTRNFRRTESFQRRAARPQDSDSFVDNQQFSSTSTPPQTRIHAQLSANTANNLSDVDDDDDDDDCEYVLTSDEENGTVDGNAHEVAYPFGPPPDNYEPPSAGSTHHWLGQCKPCVFFYGKGCKNGPDCHFCHEVHPRKKRIRKISGAKLDKLLERASHRPQADWAVKVLKKYGHLLNNNNNTSNNIINNQQFYNNNYSMNNSNNNNLNHLNHNNPQQLNLNSFNRSDSSNKNNNHYTPSLMPRSHMAPFPLQSSSAPFYPVQPPAPPVGNGNQPQSMFTTPPPFTHPPSFAHAALFSQQQQQQQQQQNPSSSHIPPPPAYAASPPFSPSQSASTPFFTGSPAAAAAAILAASPARAASPIARTSSPAANHLYNTAAVAAAFAFQQQAVAATAQDPVQVAAALQASQLASSHALVATAAANAIAAATGDAAAPLMSPASPAHSGGSHSLLFAHLWRQSPLVNAQSQPASPARSQGPDPFETLFKGGERKEEFVMTGLDSLLPPSVADASPDLNNF